MRNVAPSKINVQTKNKIKYEYYPCLCEAANLVLWLGRISGVRPIVSQRKCQENHQCRFHVSKNWKRYSCILQIIYVTYCLIIYGVRLTCGPNLQNTMLWYVMTVGYMLNDIDSFGCICTGTIFAENVGKLLEKMASLNGDIKEMQYLKNAVQNTLTISFLCYLAMLFSYTYVSIRRFVTSSYPYDDDYCNLLEFHYIVLLRAGLLIFPFAQHMLITLLCLMVNNKFKYLMEKIELTLRICSNIKHSGEAVPESLEQLTSDHTEISLCLNEINKCVGLQLLTSTATSLYGTIYFLYRYSISSRESLLSNSHERMHYIIAIIYRVGNLLHYMILGRNVVFWSQGPLRALQNNDIINLPFRMQQQVQTLILQWSGKKGQLSAMGVIHMGPWLVAPIIGNVITYLLVALQFDSSSVLQSNLTAILESFI